MSISVRLKKLMDDRKLTPGKLAAKAELPRETVYKIVSGERPTPTLRTLQRLAEALSVSISYFTDDADTAPVVKEDRAAYEVTPAPRRKVPVIGRISAGPPIIAFPEYEEYIEVPEDELNGGEYLFFRVKGDSMVGEGIYPGSIVLVRQTPKVDPGRLAVVLVDKEEATLKRIYPDNGTVTLRGSNPAYADSSYPARDISIIGEVVELRRSFR